MKTSAIIRLILFSFTALLLTGILITGIAFSYFDFSFFGDIVEEIVGDLDIDIGGVIYGDSEKYTSAEGSIELDGIEYIDIDWVGGHVSIKSYDGKTVKFSEDASGLGENEKMHYYVNNNKLFIRYRKSANFSIKQNYSKRLELLVPANELSDYLKELDVNSVSGGINISEMRIGELDIEAVSGKIELENVTSRSCNISNISGAINASSLFANTLDIETVSGRTDISGEIYDEIDFESVSGSCTFKSGVCPKDASIETVSGDATLRIPENTGFTLSCDSIRSSYTSDFPLSGSKNRGVYGDGSAQFEFDSVSGKIHIGRNA